MSGYKDNEDGDTNYCLLLDQWLTNSAPAAEVEIFRSPNATVDELTIKDDPIVVKLNGTANDVDTKVEISIQTNKTTADNTAAAAAPPPPPPSIETNVGIVSSHSTSHLQCTRI